MNDALLTAGRDLILASSSPYRRALLARLGLSFTCASPDVDETPRAGECGAPLALRLALAKAEALRRRHPAALIIGSDQTATLDGRTLGKPGTREAALAQLAAVAGREVVFDTAVCVLDARDGTHASRLVPTRVSFRALDAAAIAAYVAREPAFDCAGAFKAEALGITLCDRIDSSDPTALIGLPLIALTGLLCAAGIDPLAR